MWLLLLSSPASLAQAPAAPQDWVTDNAGFLSQNAREELNARLRNYQDATGHQVYVWIGKTTGGVPIEDWAVKAFEAWKVGREKFDDGIVLFIFTQDRTARIEVGYGLEGDLPDATASRIINEDLIPKIKSGEPDAAVTAAVDHILRTLGGETGGGSGPESISLTPAEEIFLFVFFIVIVLLAIRFPTFGTYLLWLLWSMAGRGSGGDRSSAGGGGGRSGGGGASGRW